MDVISYVILDGVSQVARVVKNPPARAGGVTDAGSIPGSGRSPDGHGYPLQCSCLENPTGRGAWRATVHGIAKSRTRLSDFTQVNIEYVFQVYIEYLPG